MRKPTNWVPTRSDTNQAVQLQKMARGLKLCIEVEDGLYYLFSENKGADQLRGYREADLHLCFCPRTLFVFPRGGSYINSICPSSNLWLFYTELATDSHLIWTYSNPIVNGPNVS